MRREKYRWTELAGWQHLKGKIQEREPKRKSKRMGKRKKGNQWEMLTPKLSKRARVSKNESNEKTKCHKEVKK